MVDYLEALERLAMPDELHIKECEKLGISLTEDYEVVKQALLELQSIKEANPSEALEAFGRITLHTEYDNDSHYDGLQFEDDCKLVDKALQRLEAIDNAKPSEALGALEDIILYLNASEPKGLYCENIETIQQALLKAREQEKENELLKEIIKSFFDRGCPLHQYTDKEGILQIEVDDECSIMHLGKFKDVDLDKKLKEVLE